MKEEVFCMEIDLLTGFYSFIGLIVFDIYTICKIIKTYDKKDKNAVIKSIMVCIVRIIFYTNAAKSLYFHIMANRILL